MQKGACKITGKELPINQLYSGDAIRDEVFQLIQSDHPDFTKDDFISVDSLNYYRRKYLENLLKDKKK